MPIFICPFCSLHCSNPEPGRSGKSEFEVDWLCKAGKTALQQVVNPSHSPEIDGRPVSWEDGLIAARQTISNARFPLVILSGGVSVEAQEKGLQLARMLHSCLDIGASQNARISSRVVHEVGCQTFTLGEVIPSQAACLFWGVSTDDRAHCPEKIISSCLENKSTLEITFTGKQGWRCAQTVEIEPGKTLSLIQNIRLGLRHPGAVFDPLVRRLIDFFQSVDNGVVFLGKDFLSEGHYAVFELSRLTEDLWQTHSWRILNMDFAPNTIGAVETLTSATGFSQPVFLAEGPVVVKANPLSARRLIEKKLVDCVIVVGSADDLPLPGFSPTIVISPNKPNFQPAVWLSCDQTGIHSTGRFIRFDGVPLQLDAFLESTNPSAERVLERLIEGVPQ